MTRVPVAALLALLCAGCPGKSDPPEGNVLAREITDPADLIGGPRSEGRVGDFLLANDHVRVVIGNAQSVVFNPFGGALLDADVVRPAGEPGNDRLGEIFPSLNVVNATNVDTVEVVEDGSSRRRASIRVRGESFPFPLIAEIPGLTSHVAVTMETVYSLTPESSSVLIETFVTMNETETTTVQAYDVMLLGAGLSLFGAPHGDTESGSDFSWYGGDAGGVAYALLPLGAPRDTISIPFSDAAQQVAMMGGLEIRPGSTKSYRRRLVIAAPDLGALGTEIARVRGQSTGRFEGSVRDTVGTPVDGALIHLTAVGVDRDGNGADDVVMRARSAADGSFATALPPGTYRAVVTGNGAQGDPLELPIRKGKLSQALFILPALGTVSFSCADGNASKLTLVAAGGGIAARALCGPQTQGSVRVPPGSYTAYVSRGPEWEVTQAPVIVTAGGAATVSATLARLVSTPGFVSGDFHLHSVRSRDSGVDVAERVLSLAAEGLEVVASTDHDRATDYAPFVTTLGLGTAMKSVVGSEVSIVLYGHFNAYPMPDGAAVTRAWDGTNMWFDEGLGRKRTGSEVLALLRGLPGDRIVQINHPRSTQAYFDSIAYDPVTGTANDTIGAFDAVEVNGEYEPVDGSTMRDWLGLLSHGQRITAVGVSDSHSTWNPGYPRTMIHVGTDAPAQVGEATLVAAMRAGKVSVSSGPFVTTSASTVSSSAGMGETLDATGGGAVAVSVHVESPAWAPYDTLRLYENGVLHTTQSLAPPLSGGKYVSDVSIPVTPAVDSFYVVIVTGAGSMYPVTGEGIYAYTNPVWVNR